MSKSGKNNILKYFWKNRIFLVFWIVIVSSLFVVYSSRLKPSFEVKVKYALPIPERYDESTFELINFYEKGKLFHKDVFLLMNSDVVKQIIEEYNFRIKKDKSTILKFSMIESDSTGLRDKLQRVVMQIDSIHVSSKIHKYNEDIDRTYAKILEIEAQKNTLKNDSTKRKEFDQYTIIEKDLENYFEFLIIKKYSYENLPDRDYYIIRIAELSTYKIILTFGGLIFAIWSGLMIIVIRYFVKIDSKKIIRNVRN